MGHFPVLVGANISDFEANKVWRVVKADDVASPSSSHQVWTSDAGSDVSSDSEYARDVA